MKIHTKKCSCLYFLLRLVCIVPISSSSDTINTAQVIRDGDTIVSFAQNFELGFFSPQNSDNRYVGVWFKNIATRTIVWVANRDSPLRNTSSGVLKVNSTGNLVILDETNNTTIWSSNESRGAMNPVIQLLDSGNLIIREDDAKDYYMWQSFDHPTDTLISGINFGWNIVPDKLIYLSSWKTDEDPATGEFTFSMDNTGYPQLVVKRGDALQCRLGPFNGLSFSGMPNHNLKDMVNITMNSSSVFFSGFNVQNSLFVFTLSPTGVGQFLTWSKAWMVLYKFPVDICDDYAACGAQGICSTVNVPFCGCLDRFMPRDTKDWASSDWSGGCVRRTPLNCKDDVFLKYSGMKMPDARLTRHDASLNLEECEAMCLRNCSCTAYSSLNISNGGSGCLMWFGDLVDIRVVLGDDQNIYIRLAASELGSKWMSQTTHIGILTSLAGLFLLGLISTLVLYIWKRNKDRKLRNEDISYEDMELPMYDLAEVAKATDDFSISRKLGEGGFGPVYKGTMEDGKEIAVKRLSETSSQGLEEFKNEILCIAKLQHRNLVKLLGWCIRGKEKMLIYEYMPNKSLDLLLFNEAESRRLDWPKRLHIINGIAKGLLYLHRDSRLRIIHRDLKASNVLLDKELNPKISDFGMARIFGGNETEGNTLRVVGTYGYMSPEYAVEGFFSLKSDVYSFGVLVLEIVSGRTSRGLYHNDHHHNLLGHAWILYKKDRSLDLVRDPNIGNSVYSYELLRSIHVALLCVQQCPEDRPSMASVVLMLGSGGVLPEAKEPGFFTIRNGVNETYSNECTNTLIEG